MTDLNKAMVIGTIGLSFVGLCLCLGGPVGGLVAGIVAGPVCGWFLNEY